LGRPQGQTRCGGAGKGSLRSDPIWNIHGTDPTGGPSSTATTGRASERWGRVWTAVGTVNDGKGFRRPNSSADPLMTNRQSPRLPRGLRAFHSSCRD
jgi:hypothetical protein